MTEQNGVGRSSATDELRRLLDERGVKWGATDTHRLLVTSWNDASGHSWAFTEHRDGGFSKLTAYHLTPEQAVAATLGELNPDRLPCGLTISDDGSLLDWRGENYVRQSILRDVKRKPNGDIDRCETCGDDRFELIDKAKKKLLECTNIESRPEEIYALDSILFRFWQMGWLDQLREAATPGGRECVMEYGGDVAEGTARVMGVYFCSECGSPNYNDCMPYYCIYCGKAVKR